MENHNNIEIARYVMEISTNVEACREPLPLSNINFNDNQLVGSGID